MNSKIYFYIFPHFSSQKISASNYIICILDRFDRPHVFIGRARRQKFHWISVGKRPANAEGEKWNSKNEWHDFNWDQCFECNTWMVLSVNIRILCSFPLSVCTAYRYRRRTFMVVINDKIDCLPHTQSIIKYVFYSFPKKIYTYTLETNTNVGPNFFSFLYVHNN